MTRRRVLELIIPCVTNLASAFLLAWASISGSHRLGERRRRSASGCPGDRGAQGPPTGGLDQRRAPPADPEPECKPKTPNPEKKPSAPYAKKLALLSPSLPNWQSRP